MASSQEEKKLLKLRQLDNFYRKHHNNIAIAYPFGHWPSLLGRSLQQK